MADLKFDYPQVLTKSAWDKHKGVMAKLVVGKTDVGASLTILEAAFKQSGFGKAKVYAGTDPTEFAAHFKAQNEALAKGLANMKGIISTAEPIANAAHTEFKNSKTVSKSSTEYAKRVVDGLAKFKKDIEPFPTKAKNEVRTDYATKVKKLSGYSSVKDAAAAGDAAYSNLMAMIKRAEATPTVANFKVVFAGDGPHRKMTTYCKLWDQLVLRDFPKSGAAIYNGKAMANIFPLPNLADVANEANFVASNKIQAAITGGQAENRAVQTFLLQYSSSAIKSKAIVDAIKKVWALLKDY